MSASGDHPKSTQQPPTHSTVLLLLGDIADTTWRMFVPTIGFIGLGFWGDSTFRGTKPWLTIAGIVVGITVTSLLIARQLKKVKQ
ncbi:hypothetical protein RAAC3_TM7C00001G0679 [Candidatus Saccharibacteria bacterium RAAC3_TM7_1]|nr:hypothetical protein RAAC3_TM7C00001G0679 [Candidatus Saccharibacteria bacterium RAAC3_TM7_1]HCZ28607.1 hypothetical protein [Candidatus Saccharibacteria bacterium]